MKITVIGSGYVGLVTGACLADLGNHVYCLDIDQKKIDLLNCGVIPIYEPGLEDLVKKNMIEKRLQFGVDIEESVNHGVIQIIAVGTPQSEDGSADVGYVINAAKNIAQYMTDFKVVVNKSTVPVGTATLIQENVKKILAHRGSSIPFSVVSNPEFLKEGAAIEDFMRPDRIIVGTQSDENGIRAKQLMSQLYGPFNRHHDRMYFMDVKSSELTKYASNAMLATRISFMNEIANLADALGADVEMVRKGIGSDTRIGNSFLYAGVGYGGSCFPKDVRALLNMCHGVGQPGRVLAAVDEVNCFQKTILIDKLLNHFKGSINGLNLAFWGLAFKPNTDDMREAPSRAMIKKLLQLGIASIAVYDPVAQKDARHALLDDLIDKPDLFNKIKFVDEPMQALKDVDALLIATEWKVFKSPDFESIKKLMKTPAIFDGRNLYDPKVMADLGISYYGVGRRA